VTKTKTTDLTKREERKEIICEYDLRNEEAAERQKMAAEATRDKAQGTAKV
jgi:hypothetical protein